MGETVVTFGEYIKEHIEFVNKHNTGGNFKYHTKTADKGFQRTFQWDNGAQWNEVTYPITEETSVETHGIVVKANVKIWCTEYWSTESKEIKCFYEQD